MGVFVSKYNFLWHLRVHDITLMTFFTIATKSAIKLWHYFIVTQKYGTNIKCHKITIYEINIKFTTKI